MSDNTKTVRILSAVSSFVKYHDDGSLDHEGTAMALLAQIEGEIEASRAYDVQISAALHTLYDKIPAGTALPTPTVIQAVAGELSEGDLVRMIELSAKVEDFVKRSPHFTSKRGRSGGLSRVSKPE